MRQFRVTAPCLANVPTSGPLGEIRQTLYTHAVFNADLVGDELLALWQERGLVAPVDPPAPAAPAVPSEPVVPSTPTGGTPPAQPPASPTTVTSRSSKEELVAYGISQGGDEAELRGMTVKDLQARYLKAPEQPK